MGLWLFMAPASAQLSITNNTNAQTLASTLAGPGVTVVPGSASLARANTSQQNTGTFSGGTTPGGPGPTVGIGSGVVLTTGNFSTSVLGPNNRKDSTVVGSTQLSDPDLTALAGSSTRYDTVILQFDVIPIGRSLNFQFVFGSEEYPEYVCSSFNDAFGLFVSGPGISGSYSLGAANLAVLPNGTRISINTINGGAVGYRAGSPVAGCNLGNTAYYTDNGDPNNPAPPNASLYTNTQLDGFTRPMRSSVVVRPGQTYRVKIAIADTMDGAYDSTVFLGLISSQSDWGDAPDSYKTTASTGGPHHDLDNRIYIGPTPPDPDANGQPGPLANGDDLNASNDENTFSELPSLTPASSSYTLNVPLTNSTGLPALLAGWIDFNLNGQFDAGERATANVPPGSTSATLQWNSLSGLTAGPTYLRLRLSSDLSFVGNPQPQDGADDGEVEDYPLTIVQVYSISGNIYHDLEPNGAKETGEDWSTGVTVYIKLVQGASVIATATVNPGSGNYSFTGLAPGSYSLVLDDNNSPTDTTPTPPAGWHFIQPVSGQRIVSITSSSPVNQDFGLFRGSRFLGKVFYDDGEAGGTANDALQQSAERGVGGIIVSASDGTQTRSSSTNGSGEYLLWIPYSWGSVTLSHPVRPATGWNDGSSATMVANWSQASSPGSPGATLSLGNASSLPANLVRNFGVVRNSALQPDQSGQASSPGTLTYAHHFRPGTPGSVSLSLPGSPSFAYQARLDANCNGTWEAGESFGPLPQTISVGSGWPREADGSLRACTLEVQVLVPAGRPPGQVDLASIQALLQWAGNPAVSEARSVVDVTTVISAGTLRLQKQVRNVSTGSPFTANVQGRPGEVLEYRIEYQNIGSQPIFNVVLADPIPFFTTLVQNAYGGTGELELACPDGTLVRPDLGSVSSISLNLASLCSLSTAPNPSGPGTLPALLPAQGGYFLYRVQVK